MRYLVITIAVSVRASLQRSRPGHLGSSSYLEAQAYIRQSRVGGRSRLQDDLHDLHLTRRPLSTLSIPPSYFPVYFDLTVLLFENTSVVGLQYCAGPSSYALERCDICWTCDSYKTGPRATEDTIWLNTEEQEDVADTNKIVVNRAIDSSRAYLKFSCDSAGSH